MQKIVNFKAITFIGYFLLISCTSDVVRWPNNFIDELQSKTVNCQLKKDIFQDILWSAPPVGSKKLLFTNNLASIQFSGEDLIFKILRSDQLSLTQNGIIQVSNLEKSKNDYYYNINKLKMKTISHSRMVPITKPVLESFPVTKTRQVSRSRQIYNSYSKSYQTQYYTDTEYYTQYEYRTVLKSDWQWKVFSEKVLDIPIYNIFKFDLAGGERIIIYKTDEGYFFQNVSYYQYKEKKKSFLKDTMVSVLIIDGTGDGKYTNAQDKILFNSWNPYENNSQFVSLCSVLDNTWITQSWLNEDQFIKYNLDKINKTIQITNANSKYLNNNLKGELEITGLEPNMMLNLNGKNYSIPKSGILKNKIEYGIYKLRIAKNRYQDYLSILEINNENTFVKTEYKQTNKIGSFTLKHPFKNWKITATDSINNTTAVFNEDNIKLLPGNYIISVNGDGHYFQKEIEIKNTENIVFNFFENSQIIED